MAMKKKLIVGITAALVTAMCLGGSVFAAGESVPVNGSGDTGTVNGTTDATVTYTKTDATPTWSVNIPKSVNFGTVNAATTALTQKLEYTANIQDTQNKIKSLKISLVDGPKYEMKDTGHDPAVTVSNAFSIKNAAGADTTANSVIAEIASGETAYAQAVLDVNAFSTATGLANGDHAFKGQFGVKIEPVKTSGN